MVKAPHQNFLEKLKNEWTTLAADGESSGEFSGYIDTGCYILNALLSGSVYGGIPNNKITAFCGESATGKSFFALSIVANFLKANPKGVVFYYDTEAAINKEVMEDRGIDTKRVNLVNPETVQHFQHLAVETLDAYGQEDADFPLLLVLDSLGNLSTFKEIKDASEASMASDMTRAKIIRATFRVLTLKCAKYKVPLLLTNHTFADITRSSKYGTPQEVSGGGGLKYAASQIIMLHKTKDREDKDKKTVVGAFIKAKLYKSRLTKEFSEVSMKLSYSKGLDRYYGLLDLAEKYGIVEKKGNKWVFAKGDDKTTFWEKQINQNPTNFWNETVLKDLDDAAKREFLYGAAKDDEDDSFEEVEGDEEVDVNA